MAIASRKIRGLRDIRTNVDRCDQFADPYKGYLRLGTLEMERSRKIKERNNLEERLRVIEERCRQLDAEKALILKIIDQRAADKRHTKQVIPISRNVHKKDIAGHLPQKYTGEAANLAASSENKVKNHSLKKTLPACACPAPVASAEPPVVLESKPGNCGFKIRY